MVHSSTFLVSVILASLCSATHVPLSIPIEDEYDAIRPGLDENMVAFVEINGMLEPQQDGIWEVLDGTKILRLEKGSSQDHVELDPIDKLPGYDYNINYSAIVEEVQDSWDQKQSAPGNVFSKRNARCTSRPCSKHMHCWPGTDKFGACAKCISNRCIWSSKIRQRGPLSDPASHRRFW